MRSLIETFWRNPFFNKSIAATKIDASIFENENDISQLVKKRDTLINRKEYALAKAANERIALLEMEQECLVYQHLPIILHAELTNLCNCSCIMCTHAYERNDKISYLNINLIEPLLPACRLVVINGIGEPFLHPNIKKILELFCKYNVKICTTTNLQHLPIDVIPYIAKQFLRVSISCDGAKKETYEQIRRGSSFEKFTNNVRILRSRCPDTWFHMAVTVMRQNIEEAVDLVELAKNLGFNEIRFGRLETNPLLKNEMDSLLHYPDLAGKELQRAKNLGKNLGIEVNIPRIFEEGYDENLAMKQRDSLHYDSFFKNDNFYDMLYEEVSSYDRSKFVTSQYSLKRAASCVGICHWLALGVNINVYGQLRPCGEIVRNLGSVIDPKMLKNGMNIMNSKEIVDLRKIFLDGYIPSVCANCSYLLSNETGSVQVEDYELKKYLLNERDVEL